jgi:predicted NAD/FAD-binding protein
MLGCANLTWIPAIPHAWAIDCRPLAYDTPGHSRDRHRGSRVRHFLQRDFDITLFEQNGYAGGHSNTVTVEEPATARSLPIDTGFMVFNKVTYPLLGRLFGQLGVETKPTKMSFSVRHADSGLEYCGSSLNHLFAQRRNLVNPRFYRMLGSISRFNREAVRGPRGPRGPGDDARGVRQEAGYGSDFLSLYLAPMSSAVWSTPPELMNSFPAVTLLRFFHNHGFLGLNTQHPWYTVSGGSRAYVEKLTAPWRAGSGSATRPPGSRAPARASASRPGPAGSRSSTR